MCRPPEGATSEDARRRPGIVRRRVLRAGLVGWVRRRARPEPRRATAARRAEAYCLRTPQVQRARTPAAGPGSFADGFLTPAHPFSIPLFRCRAPAVRGGRY